MDRINSDNIGYDSQGRRIFKDDPPATTINDQWCNGIQEELMAVIESEGFAGNISDNTLLLKAMTAAIARATDNYVTIHDLGTKNILSANSGVNLDLYISGGLLAKPTGWKCKFRASNGLGTSFYNLSPSTSYTINGISALNWKMYGIGELQVELDNENGNWKILQDSSFIFDEWSVTFSSVAFKNMRQINGNQRLEIIDANLRTTATGTTLVYFVTVNYDITSFYFTSINSMNDSTMLESAHFPCIDRYTLGGLTTFQIGIFGNRRDAAGYPRFAVVGRWRS